MKNNQYFAYFKLLNNINIDITKDNLVFVRISPTEIHYTHNSSV